MAIEATRWTLAILVCLVLGWAAVSDIRDRRIPNAAVLATAALFAGWVFVGPSVSLGSSLIAAGIAFVVSTALYAVKIIGAGDSKLVTVAVLFVGLQNLALFAVMMSLVGGVMAIGIMMLHPARALAMVHMKGKGDFGRGVPYGVAIAIATMAVIVPQAAMH